MSVAETDESSTEVEWCLECVDESAEAHPPCDSWWGAVTRWNSVSPWTIDLYGVGKTVGFQDEIDFIN